MRAKYQKETGDSRPIILASTASPYKFSADVAESLGEKLTSEEPGAVLEALSRATGTEIPAPLSRTLTMPVRFTQVIEPEKMSEVIFA